MESFRNLLKGWLGKVLLVLFLAPLALVGIEGYFSGGQSKDSVKSVNGKKISEIELEALTKSFQQQYLQYANGDETLLNQTFIRDKALDSLIIKALLLQQAEKLGISLSDAQIEQMIAQQPSFQQNGQFSKELFAQYLSSQGFSNSQTFIANIRQDHALKMLTSSIANQALVSKNDLKQIVDLQTEKRTLHLASVSLEPYKKNVKVSEQEIENYYNKHAANFKQSARVDVDYVVLSPAMFKSEDIQVTDLDLQQAYSKFVEVEQQKLMPNVRHILVSLDGKKEEDAQKLINQAFDELKSDTDFAIVAQKYSDDTSSKNSGGQLAAYDKGLFGEEFDQAVASLKIGEISKPIKTQFGYEIIQTQAANNTIPTFESQKDRLVDEVKKLKRENAFTDSVNGLNEMVVGSDALETITQEVKDSKIESVKAFTLTSQHPVLSDPAVKAMLFSDDVKNGDRNVTSSLQLVNGDIAWVKVRNYYAAGVQSLVDATPRIKEKIIEEKAYAAAKAEIQKTLNDFKIQPASKVVKESGIRFESARTFSRAVGLLKPQIERVAFSLPAPKSSEMWSVTTTALPNEMVIIAVSNVEIPKDLVLPPEEIQQVSILYQQLRAQQELDAYTDYLKSQAEIK